MNVRPRDMPRFLRDHRWTRGHMSEYIDAELAPEQSARVEEHVSRCPQCHRLLAGLKRTVGALHQLRRGPGEDPGVADQVIGRLREEG